MSGPVSTIGRHLLAEYSGCDPTILDDEVAIEALLVRAAEAAGATVVARVFHRFRPHGVTGVVVIEESHLSIHAWPEARYASADFYTCGDCDAEVAHALIAEGLRATSSEVVRARRGLPGERRIEVLGHRPVKSILVECCQSNLPDTVRVGPSPGRGLGLFATRDLCVGELIYSALARFSPWDTQLTMRTDLGDSILTAEEAGYEIAVSMVERWSERIIDDLVAHYELESRSPKQIHAAVTDGRDRLLLTGFDGLVNHAGDPNTFIDWPAATMAIIDDEPHWTIAVRARRAITVGDELFDDYGQGDFDFSLPEGWTP